MGSREQWLTRLKNEFSNSPLVSNVVFGFILTGLEKLVELEFVCPCKPIENEAFSSAFFIIPAVTAFFLMLIFQGCEYDPFMTTVYSTAPAIVWLILIFFDGQYYACARTYWEGRYVLVNNAGPQKWCEPTNVGNVTSQELMRYSQRQFFISQGIGIIVLIVFICAGFVVYMFRKKCQPKVETQGVDETELTVFRTE